MAELPRLLVVDASVVLKWQLEDEEYVPQAVAIKDEFLIKRVIALIAPQLLVYEAVNGILSAVKKKRIEGTLARQMIGNIATSGIELRPVNLDRMVDFAFQFNLSAYDAAYVALADAEGCELWTGDRPFYQAVRQHLPMVRWIGDYVPVPER